MVVKYFNPEFIEHLEAHKHIDDFALAITWIPSQVEYFDKNLLELAKKELHIIGMTHGSDDIEFDEMAIQSQLKVTELLKSICPDLVGIEGFSGDIFTVKDWVIEHIKKLGQKNPTVSQVLSLTTRFKNEPTINGTVNYQKIATNTKFVGVESEFLSKLHVRSLKENDRISNLGYPKKFIEKWDQCEVSISQLRGYYMLSKLNECSNNMDCKKLALPIGYAHMMEEIMAIIKAIKPDQWNTYKAIK